MGGAAVHTGKIITWDEVMASSFQFCANVDTLTADSPAPVQADERGRYPVPMPELGSDLKKILTRGSPQDSSRTRPTISIS